MISKRDLKYPVYVECVVIYLYVIGDLYSRVFYSADSTDIL